MRVLMVTREHPPYSWAGMSMVCQALEKFLPENGVELTIIAPSAKVAGADDYIKSGVKTIYAPIFGNSFLPKIPSFSYFASRLVAGMQKDYDVIYSHATPLFCKLERPLVVHFHGTRLGEYSACLQAKKYAEACCNLAYVFFDRNLLQKADGVIVLTEAMRQQIAALNVPGRNTVVIPNGVNTDFFCPIETERNFEREKEKRILYVGRLDARKGLETLIRAVSQVQNKVNAKLIIAGGGREATRLMNLAAKLGVPVDFKGKVPHSNLPRLYNEADIFVLPSLYEGFPLVLLEAIACGTPTISSTACPDVGVPQFAPANSDELAELLLTTLTCPERLTTLSQRCLDISRQYRWQEIVAHITRFLREV